jgi:hypothetical protein
VRLRLLKERDHAAERDERKLKPWNRIVGWVSGTGFAAG